jgi:surface protein
METKQRFITMFIALVAMFMGTKVMAQEAYAVLSDDGKTLTFRYDSSKSSYGDKAYDLNEGDNEPEWYGITSVETVVFEESFATVRPVSTCSWFDCFTNLTEIVGMEYLNTSEVTTMNSMFECCSKITNLDLSHFYTSKVTNMKHMFQECQAQIKTTDSKILGELRVR